MQVTGTSSSKFDKLIYLHQIIINSILGNDISAPYNVWPSHPSCKMKKAYHTVMNELGLRICYYFIITKWHCAYTVMDLTKQLGQLSKMARFNSITRSTSSLNVFFYLCF